MYWRHVDLVCVLFWTPRQLGLGLLCPSPWHPERMGLRAQGSVCFLSEPVQCGRWWLGAALSQSGAEMTAHCPLLHCQCRRPLASQGRVGCRTGYKDKTLLTCMFLTSSLGAHMKVFRLYETQRAIPHEPALFPVPNLCYGSGTTVPRAVHWVVGGQ